MNTIEFDSGPTPNGRKVAIVLEACQLSFAATFIDILAGDQLNREFLALNPNHKHPVIVDPDGPAGRPVPVWESGAILLYLAKKMRDVDPARPGTAHRDVAVAVLPRRQSGTGERQYRQRR